MVTTNIAPANNTFARAEEFHVVRSAGAGLTITSKLSTGDASSNTITSSVSSNDAIFAFPYVAGSGNQVSRVYFEVMQINGDGSEGSFSVAIL